MIYCNEWYMIIATKVDEISSHTLYSSISSLGIIDFHCQFRRIWFKLFIIALLIKRFSLMLMDNYNEIHTIKWQLKINWSLQRVFLFVSSTNWNKIYQLWNKWLIFFCLLLRNVLLKMITNTFGHLIKWFNHSSIFAPASFWMWISSKIKVAHLEFKASQHFLPYVYMFVK